MIAIHNIDSRYSERWKKYCEEQHIEFINVNIYDSNIINHLKGNNVHILFAQPANYDYKTSLIAKAILFSIESAGIRTFPNYRSFWHYDDKISQKYLFEALGIPHARMHVFYNKSEASEWLSTADLPIVFKLSCGSKSSNVLLLKNKKDAARFINKMFGSGIKPVRSAFNDLVTKISIHSDKKDWLGTFIRFRKTFRNIIEINKKMPRHKGYFLVQEFLPNNSFDTRVVIVGNKAFAFRRNTRSKDFRASGSQNVDLNQDKVDKRTIALSFEAAQKIGSDSMAFDIIFDTSNNPVIIEISYTCPVETLSMIGGYWDSLLVFHDEPVVLEDIIFKYVIGSANLSF